jgi:DnaJ family protein C protein 25
MTPKVDVRIVLIVTISVISVFQYYTALFRWNSGMKYLATQPKYRSMALQVAEEDGLLDNVKKMKKRNKEEMRAEEERIIRTVLENKMDIRGGYARPTIQDVLWMQILLLPKSIFLYFKWYILWLWKFNIKGQEYGNEEKFYIIRKLMGISETQFEAIPENEKEDFLDMELWIKENYDEWKAEKEEEYKRQMAQSGRMKSYRRYLKKHGPGRMYFDDS